VADSAAYWEFNFSPSLEWAAYRFSGYREDMTDESGFTGPRIETQSHDYGFRLSAVLNLSGITALRPTDEWWLAISAVIEGENGGKSYWALAHSEGRPDFHHRAGFVLHLPP
jgi:hypothetical protein